MITRRPNVLSHNSRWDFTQQLMHSTFENAVELQMRFKAERNISQTNNTLGLRTSSLNCNLQQIHDEPQDILPVFVFNFVSHHNYDRPSRLVRLWKQVYPMCSQRRYRYRRSFSDKSEIQKKLTVGDICAIKQFPLSLDEFNRVNGCFLRWDKPNQSERSSKQV